MLPDTIDLTPDQFQLFLEMTVTTDEGREILKEIRGEAAAATAEPQGEGAAQTDTPAAEPEPTRTAAQDTATAEPQGAGAGAHHNHRHNQKPHQTGQNGGTGILQNGTTKPTE